VPLAVVALDFDPVVRLGGVAVRLETLGVAAALAIACIVGGLIARRTPADPRAPDDRRLRPDDVVFVVLAAIPGAIVGGRLGYGLVHLDRYASAPAALLDPGQGSFELTLGVVGAALTAGYAGRLLTGAARPWFHAAALPTLLAIGAGKVALAVGGTGQGVPSDAAWATAYLGPGPWGSLAPELPSVPAQLLEAAGTAAVAVLLVALSAAGGFRAADGRAWLAAIGGWALVRVVVAGTWRDGVVLGPLRAEQLIAMAVVGACTAAWVLLPRLGSRPARATRESIVAPDHMTTGRDGHDPALQGSEERT
jgi:prolipoprotein diacylglyceryltransferase